MPVCRLGPLPDEYLGVSLRVFVQLPANRVFCPKQEEEMKNERVKK